MRIQQLERLLSDEVMQNTHPVDPILKEIVTKCVDESVTWNDAQALISQAFASIHEHVDMIQTVVMNAMSQLNRP